MAAYASKTNSQSQNTFMDHMSAAIGATAHRIMGENGSDMYSMYGIKGDNQTPAQAALVAAFSGIVDDTSDQAVRQYFQNAYDAILNDSSLTARQQANYLADLIVYMIYIRDIRNNGKGRRDQCFAAFFWLRSYIPHFSNIMDDFLPMIVKHGSWGDLKLIYAKSFTQTYMSVTMQIQADKSSSLGFLRKRIVTMFVNQVKADRAILDDYLARKRETEREGHSFNEKCNLSLAVKWLPKENRSLDKKYKIAKRFAQEAFSEEFSKDFKVAMRLWRQFYAPVQDVLKTTEKLQCQGKYDEIEFRTVPGKCMFKQKKAFLYEQKKEGNLRGSDPKRLQCRDNLMNFLKKATDGKVSVHGKTMYIHELAQHVYRNYPTMSEGDKLLINAQFNDHVKHFQELMAEKGLAIDKGLVQADVSGSMEGPPMAGSLSLAILVSTLARGQFRNKFMTFHSTPQLIELVYPRSREDFDRASQMGEGSHNYLGSSSSHPLGIWNPTRTGGELTFCEKVAIAYSSGWGGNTDFLACHDLILDIGVKNHLAPEDQIEWVLTASDMQFDEAGRGNGGNTYQYVGAHNRASYQYGSYSGKTKRWQDHHQILVESYDRVGRQVCGRPWTLPTQIYWNMRSTKSFVTKADTPGVQMVGGMSTMQMKLFLEEMDLDPTIPDKPKVTPWDTFRKAVDNECYQEVRRLIEWEGTDAGNPIFQYYTAPVLESEGWVEPVGPAGGEVTTASSKAESKTHDTPQVTVKNVAALASAVRKESVPSDTVSVTSSRSSRMDPIEKLRAAKKMLDEGLIEKSDYDQMKANFILM